MPQYHDPAALAAQLLGMKTCEISAVEPAEDGDGLVVTTHDGVRTLVTEDGRQRMLAAAAPVPRDPSTGALVHRGAAGGAQDPRACPHCGGSGRVRAEEAPPAGAVPRAWPSTAAAAAVSMPAELRTPAEVRGWVANDAQRARVALAAEQQRDKPRPALVEELTKVAG
jgi:hypothetical protein